MQLRASHYTCEVEAEADRATLEAADCRMVADNSLDCTAAVGCCLGVGIALDALLVSFLVNQ